MKIPIMMVFKMEMKLNIGIIDMKMNKLRVLNQIAI